MSFAEYCADKRISEEKSGKETIWVIRYISPGTKLHNMVLGSGLDESAAQYLLERGYESLWQ